MLRTLAGKSGCWIVIALGCLSDPLLAQLQTFSRPETNPSEARYSISGTVVNAVTGEPIRRALVQIYAGADRSVLTEANGQFEFDDLPPGQTSINVRKPGYFDERQLRASSDELSMLAIGPDARPFLLKLVPEGVIYGRVQNLNGEPIESLPVNLITSRIVDGRKQWEHTSIENTNDDGEFRIANLRPGVYYLEIGPELPSRDLDPSKRTANAYPALFYPGTADLTSATPLEVGPGQQLNADFSVRPVPFFKVSGVIDGLDPARGVNLQFQDRLANDFSTGERFDPATGQFQTAAPAGSYTLIATSWGAGGEAWTAQIPLDITSDVSGIRMALGPDNPIPVQVRTEPTQSSNRSAGAGSVPVPMIRFTDTSHLVAQSYAAGPEGDPKKPVFVLRNLRPGKYSVEVNTNGSWYVAAAQCGETDLLSNDLIVMAGIQTPPIEIVLRDDGATLAVQLNTGSGPTTARPTRATVVLRADHGSFVRAENISVDGGTIELQNLPPGGYNLFAFNNTKELEYRNLDVLERYISSATHVILQPNEQHKADVELIKVTN
jgi:hypothetical protein